LFGPSPLAAKDKPFKKRQLKAVDLRAEGYSYDSIAQILEVTPKTIYQWKKNPEWDRLLKERQDSWVEEYENTFSRLMPKAAQRHTELLDSESEAIKMRAVDSAHANHVRCVREKEVKSEVEELKDMVRLLLEQLAQERAAK
jgi:predicted transcriptional regulator